MTERKLKELAVKTLQIVNELIHTTDLQNVSSDQEIQIVARLAPVILDELIAMEEEAEEWDEEDEEEWHEEEDEE